MSEFGSHYLFIGNESDTIYVKVIQGYEACFDYGMKIKMLRGGKKKAKAHKISVIQPGRLHKKIFSRDLSLHLKENLSILRSRSQNHVIITRPLNTPLQSLPLLSILPLLQEITRSLRRIVEPIELLLFQSHMTWCK